MRLDGEHLDRDPFLLEYLLEILGRLALRARRIGGVHAQERLEVLHRLCLDLRPIRSVRLLGDDGRGDEQSEV